MTATETVTLRAPVLDETMTWPALEREARGRLLDALGADARRLARVNSITLEGDDILYVAVSVELLPPSCKYCGEPLPEGRRVMCGSRQCLTISKRHPAQAALEDRDPGQWDKCTLRRAAVRSLTEQGYSIREIALRVLGDDGKSAQRTIVRDRAILRARAS